MEDLTRKEGGQKNSVLCSIYRNFWLCHDINSRNQKLKTTFFSIAGCSPVFLFFKTKTCKNTNLKTSKVKKALFFLPSECTFGE